jgi:serine/threonine-protein kinase
MGSVWRAKHRTLGRSFAVKFLKTSPLGGEPLEQRFLREARLAAAIQHRFVVDIVDYGVIPDGSPYMVMEYLEGESLDRRIRRMPPLSVRELLRIASDVLLGLEAVHQAGVIHRDLKPENIMLVREADGVIPKLVDFGISRPEAERTEGRKRLTHPGVFMGTPWYMSPEQARREEVDRRSDIYSMGVIVYEALTGEAPYDHPELTALLDAVRAGGARPLSSRRPELGAELSGAIERAMAVDPAARFQSAAELSARLGELAATLPEALACPEPPVVARTDTEVIDRPANAARARTEELSGEPQDLVLAGAGGAWLDARRERVLGLAGALLGAAMLVWAAARARRPAPLETIAPLQAAVQAPAAVAAEMLNALASARGDPTGRAEPAPPTFSATRAPALEATAAALPAEEPRRAGRRPRPAEARPRGRSVAVPDVFRTPGF